MANTAEMLRLMRHAADLLDAQDPGANAAMVADCSSLRGKAIEAAERAAAQAVANGVASAVLRMVAAAVDDEPMPPDQPDSLPRLSGTHTDGIEGEEG